MQSLFAGIAGGLMMAVALIYIRNVRHAKIGMNPSTWVIATIATIIQNITYYPTVGRDWHLLVVPTAMSLGITTITVLAWRKSKFGTLEFFDKIIIAITVACLAIWVIFGGVVANVVLQSALFASVIPTVRDLRAKKFRDDPFPWGLATFGYIFQTIAVVISVKLWSDDWPRLVNPILVGLIGNSMVSWAAWWRNRQPDTD